MFALLLLPTLVGTNPGFSEDCPPGHLESVDLGPMDGRIWLHSLSVVAWPRVRLPRVPDLSGDVDVIRCDLRRFQRNLLADAGNRMDPRESHRLSDLSPEVLGLLPAAEDWIRWFDGEGFFSRDPETFWMRAPYVDGELLDRAVRDWELEPEPQGPR